MAYEQVILNNVSGSTEATVSLRSSSTILNCVSGSATVSDVSHGGDNLLATIDPATKQVLDYYPGALLKVVSTSPGTTVVFGIHGDYSL